jgi:hypothetical protein
LTISSSQIVYVKVKAWQYQVLKLFIENECYSLTISSSQNAFVNVTHHSMNNIKFSNCLCECYSLSSSQNVYVNVTHKSMNNIKFSNCLCECCGLTISSSQNVYVNVTHNLWTISSSQFVHVNDTYSMNNNILYQVKLFILWMLHITYHSMKEKPWQYQVFSNCLCKCYTSFYEQYQVLKLIVRMLHVILWAISSSQIVFYVNVAHHSVKNSQVLTLFM